MSAAQVENGMAKALAWAVKGEPRHAGWALQKAQKAAAEAGLSEPSLPTDVVKKMWKVVSKKSMAKALASAREGDPDRAREFEEEAQNAAAEAGLSEPSLSTRRVKKMYTVAKKKRMAEACASAREGDPDRAREFEEEAQNAAAEAGKRMAEARTYAAEGNLRMARQLEEEAQEAAAEAGLSKPSLSTETIKQMCTVAEEKSIAEAMDWAAKGEPRFAGWALERAQTAAAEAGLSKYSLSTDVVKEMWKVVMEKSMAKALVAAAEEYPDRARNFEKEAQEAAAKAGLSMPSLPTNVVQQMCTVAKEKHMAKALACAAEGEPDRARNFEKAAQEAAAEAGLPTPYLSTATTK
ncbi:hypothetical protein N7444_001945 [Penicillium canescens]|nr:hypothetical protein N7444_001945 [Penicillium canescens]